MSTLGYAFLSFFLHRLQLQNGKCLLLLLLYSNCQHCYVLLCVCMILIVCDGHLHISMHVMEMTYFLGSLQCQCLIVSCTCSRHCCFSGPPVSNIGHSGLWLHSDQKRGVCCRFISSVTVKCVSPQHSQWCFTRRQYVVCISASQPLVHRHPLWEIGIVRGQREANGELGMIKTTSNRFHAF